jgi:uncharacterized protein YqgC (DUF456 family)
MDTVGIFLVGVVIAVGLAGILIPLLPGTLLVFAAIGVWAFVEQTVPAWVTFGVVTAILAATLLIKYLWPVKRMRTADVSTGSLFAGAALGFVGFFVIPVAGLVVGFVLGIYLAELAKRRDQTRAWASTVHALKGVALSVGVELAGGLLATVVWVIGVVVS